MSDLYGAGASPDEFYKGQEEVKEKIAEWLKRDTEERIPQFSRIFAASVGQRLILDRPPAERLALYRAHPPILPDGTVSPDIAGVYPYWTAMAAEMPALWQEMVEDYLKLNERDIAKLTSNGVTA